MISNTFIKILCILVLFTLTIIPTSCGPTKSLEIPDVQEAVNTRIPTQRSDVNSIRLTPTQVLSETQVLIGITSTLRAPHLTCSAINMNTPLATQNANSISGTPDKPTTTPSPPSASLTPTDAPTIEPLNSDLSMALYLFSYEFGYIETIYNREFQRLENANLLDDGLDDDIGPGDAISIQLSHFTNRLAYWTKERTTSGMLWLSGPANQDLVKLFTDWSGEYPEDYHYFPGGGLDLVWSADDRYLFVRVPENPRLNLIYDVEKNSLQPWPYFCDRISLSPKSGRLATWCPWYAGTNRYAVLEWGGEIWYSSQAPAEVLVQQLEWDRLETWAWSPDGTKLAYYDAFDPNHHLDMAGSLKIVNEKGELLLETLPHTAYWYMVGRGRAQYFQIEPTDYPIQWSALSDRLLINALGSDARPCPSKAGDKIQDPCWQVIDVESGEIIWSINEVTEEFIMNTPFEDVLFYPASISPDGSMVFVRVAVPGLIWTGLIDIDQHLESAYDFRTDQIFWAFHRKDK